MPNDPNAKYVIVETTCLQTRGKSFKIFERGSTGLRLPLVAGLPTRESAEAKVKELSGTAESST